MEYENIISQLDDHNEVGIILCKKYSIKKSLIIVSKKEEEKYNLLKKTYEEILPRCILKRIYIEAGDKEKIVQLLDEYKESRTLINLTGGERINSLLLFKEALNIGLDSIYVDLINKRNYFFDKESKISTQVFEDLSIEEITKLSGAGIINDSNYLFSKKDIVEITKKIYTNLELWEKYKNKLYDTKIFNHDYRDSANVIINISELNDEEKIILNRCIKFIKDIGSIEYHKVNNEIEVKFKNSYLKGFLFKSGTWLEVLTKIIIEEIREVDEVKSGVEFYWSCDDKIVKNELDVVAIKDSVLMCISCKDSDKYDENALNELQVYSDKIGGENVIKILVATKLPIKKTIVQRAKEMDINLVVLNNNINDFREQLTKVVNIIKK